MSAERNADLDPAPLTLHAVICLYQKPSQTRLGFAMWCFFPFGGACVGVVLSAACVSLAERDGDGA